MRRRFVTIAFAALVATTPCSSPSAWADTSTASLDERSYVESVLRAGLAARVADAEADLGRAEGVGVGRLPNPALSWQREGAGSGPTTQDFFSLSLPLVLSGRLGLEREAAAQGGQAATARQERARAELRFEAMRRFYAVLVAKERRVIFEASRAALRELAGTIAARERAGDASGYDRLRIGLEAAAVDDLGRGATIEERSVRAAALALLGPEVSASPDFAGSLGDAAAHAEPMVAARDLEARRGDLRALASEARAAASAERAAGRSWIPDPVINGGAQILDAGRPNEKRGYVVGVELPIPIFQRRQGEAARAGARRNLADARRAVLTHEAKIQVNALTAELAARRARLESHRKEVLEPTEELRRIAHTAYRGGASDLLVLVDAERAAREAQLRAVDLSAAVIEAGAELALLSGANDRASGAKE